MLKLIIIIIDFNAGSCAHAHQPNHNRRYNKLLLLFKPRLVTKINTETKPANQVLWQTILLLRMNLRLVIAVVLHVQLKPVNPLGELQNRQ